MTHSSSTIVINDSSELLEFVEDIEHRFVKVPPEGARNYEVTVVKTSITMMGDHHFRTKDTTGVGSNKRLMMTRNLNDLLDQVAKAISDGRIEHFGLCKVVFEPREELDEADKV